MQLSKITILALICFLAQLLIAASILWAAEEDLEDKDITNAIETELRLDDGVSSHLIDIATKDGVIMLSGSVDNILAEERAIKIAQSIKGVRSVIDKIEVKAVERSKTQIYQDVTEALLFDPVTESLEVDVQVEDGIVTLTGNVDSYAEKQLCAEVVKGVKGVKEIENKIDINYKQNRPDSEIKTEIEKRLKFDVWVDDGLITVEVNNGSVKLTGTVGSAVEKSQAKIDAWVAGVNSVDASELEVEWWAREEMRRQERYADLTDEQIESAVKDALSYDPRAWEFRIDVDVNNGVATLMGTVDNLKAKRTAEADAKNTIGVLRVKNYLRVRPGIPLPDEEIAVDINDALMRNPYVDRYEIRVSVYNGKAYLYGSVDTLFEKHQAENVASQVMGVVEVENNLKVDYEWSWKEDWAIKQDIEEEFFWSPFVDGDEVNVTVEDGVATLEGTVGTWFEFNKARENAIEGGAKRVINNLMVK